MTELTKLQQAVREISELRREIDDVGLDNLLEDATEEEVEHFLASLQALQVQMTLKHDQLARVLDGRRPR